MKRHAQAFFIMFMALAIAACAMAPQTPKQTMAATYVAIESMADTALIAYQAGEIDRAITTKIYQKLQEAKGYVDLTAMVGKGELTDTDVGRIEQARNILLEIEKLLQEKANE